MSSVEINIVVEGQTEQTFVRDILAPVMAINEIYLYPAIIGKPGQKGGDIRFDRAQNDIGNFLKQRPETYVSTMFDFFRIEAEWPGRNQVRQIVRNGTAVTTKDKANTLEQKTLAAIQELFPDCNAESRFIPYIEMHEFEALLFSNANILATKARVDVRQINNILDQFSGPEDINDNPETAPSKRLKTLNPDYRKVAMGKSISDAIGIPAIREQCPHFNDWLTKLENL